ncbi:5'-nucleotidase C-terminal domain-containing protein [Halobacteria archaeon AArc-curdl1]|uniref:5'-nucleotidase C-terminal domain-containing protein n=1 Tax=Natronosalvus hydrolyticus TaxID=2979988 RepID=A0AAP2ZC20_9EURY|nr:5'-nucleotidase C-terminal domain-containing protein [Halobacteria archaeon AArc-curdl1]
MPPRLLQYSDVENACDNPSVIGRLARTIARYRDDHTLVVGTGDNTSPGVLPLVTEGRQALRFYQAIDPDFETFGNHDFDHGLEATRDIVKESPQTWLTANVNQNGARFAAESGVQPWAVREVAGTRLGFTGVTTPRTVSLNPMATPLEIDDPVQSVRDALSALQDEDVDYTVVCSHLGRGDDELARAVDADVIAGGHVPSVRTEIIDGTLLTRPGDGGSAIVEVTFEGETPSATIRRTSSVEPDLTVVSAFEELFTKTGLDEVVSHTETPLDRSETTIFGGECRLGNFVTDAYRWKTGADVALQNSGGLRTGQTLEGAVTAADVISLVPFEEPVAVAEVTGRQLERIFEGGAGVDLGFAEPNWWHAQVSGATLEWDPRDHTVSVIDIDGEALDPDGCYHLATSDYLFHTDDEFAALEPAYRIERTAETQYEVLLEYARHCGVETKRKGRVLRLDDTELSE